MKLLEQTQRLFFQAILPVFTVAGIIMYFAIRWVVTYEADEKLAGVKSEIEAYAKTHDTLPRFFQTIDDYFDVKPLPDLSPNIVFTAVFSDTTMLNPLENEEEPFRQIVFPLMMHGKTYRISIGQSTLENEDIAIMVTAIVGVLFGLLFGVMFWINRVVSQTVWRPFYEVLGKMHVFRPGNEAIFTLPASKIDEFQELHNTLEHLSKQIKKDFYMVRQFTENAGHELQTPLAVIQNKVEILLQDKSLSASQAHHLDIIAQSTRRMARLNHSLLLLSKIENFQFFERNVVSLRSILEKKTIWLDDFIQEKNLILERSLEDKSVNMNPFLAETLISNLLTNAIKHNVEGGWISICLNDEELCIKNSAAHQEIPVPDLTVRFARGNTQNDGIGLGLSIVSEICSQEKFKLYLNYEGDKWITRIEF